MKEVVEEHFEGQVAVKALVRCGTDFLLVRGMVAGESWDLAGGHLHIHESAETCLRRELQEELGIEAGSFRLFHSEQFFHPGPQKDTLMLTYEAVVENKDIVPAQDELSEVAWFSQPALETLPVYQNVRNALETYFKRS